MTIDQDPSRMMASAEAESFYAEALRVMRDSGIPFLVSGTYAVNAYTGLCRPTKDIDVFCKAGDFPRLLGCFAPPLYRPAIEDERWLAKVYKGEHFFDIIFNSSVGITPITEAWFAEAHEAEVLGVPVRLVPPTEMIWSKAFVQHRERYDGADIAHLILRRHQDINWQRLLNYMDPYWEVLLAHIINFRFIYPADRERVPRWLFDELMERLRMQSALPAPQIRVCRGRLLSSNDYLIDVKEWGYNDVVGKES